MIQVRKQLPCCHVPDLLHYDAVTTSRPLRRKRINAVLNYYVFFVYVIMKRNY